MHHDRIIAAPAQIRSPRADVPADMTYVPARLRAAILALLVVTLVACTPGGGATTTPSASSPTQPSSAPASAAPSSSTSGAYWPRADPSSRYGRSPT